MKYGNYRIRRNCDSFFPYEVVKDGDHMAYGKNYQEALEEIIADLQRGLFIVEERSCRHDWTYAGSAETLEEARKIANLSPKSAGVRIIQVVEYR